MDFAAILETDKGAMKKAEIRHDFLWKPQPCQPCPWGLLACLVQNAECPPRIHLWYPLIWWSDPCNIGSKVRTEARYPVRCAIFHMPKGKPRHLLLEAFFCAICLAFASSFTGDQNLLTTVTRQLVHFCKVHVCVWVVAHRWILSALTKKTELRYKKTKKAQASLAACSRAWRSSGFWAFLFEIWVRTKLRFPHCVRFAFTLTQKQLLH